MTVPGAALLSVAAAAQAPDEGYRAQGSDPAWSLAIADGRLTFEGADGLIVDMTAPPPRTVEGITYYQLPKLEISIIPGACTERATGRRYSDSVFVTANRRHLGGCGGTMLPADSLDGTSWHFVEIGGEPTELTGELLRDDRYAIDFGADRFSGYSGCNRIGGRYRIADGVMTIEEFGSTRRGCPEPAAHRELMAWRIMSGPMRVSRPSAYLLQLSGEAGTIRLRRSPD